MNVDANNKKVVTYQVGEIIFTHIVISKIISNKWKGNFSFLVNPHIKMMEVNQNGKSAGEVREKIEAFLNIKLSKNQYSVL